MPMASKDHSVWEWIAGQCLRRGWHASAGIAKQIAKEERNVLAHQCRADWGIKKICFDLYMDKTSYPGNFLVAVARYRNIKAGCLESRYECQHCLLASSIGPCNQKGSVSYLWQCLLLLDSHEDIDEELQQKLKAVIDRRGRL